jgi:hypothetical protein
MAYLSMDLLTQSENGPVMDSRECHSSESLDHPESICKLIFPMEFDIAPFSTPLSG